MIGINGRGSFEKRGRVNVGVGYAISINQIKHFMGHLRAGRIVDHDKRPVAECGVRMYRGAMDSILPADFDLFAPESTYVPNYIAGEGKTALDGTWQLTGVWPRGFYLLLAGIGTDTPTHQIVTRTPSPGEVIDLGDIVLPNTGVLTGTVLDEGGNAVAGALVRAADLPGTLAALFPIERIDPEGAVLMRDGDFPVKVVVMPPWVKTAFDSLPIPSTHTDADGRFRLVGVVAGNNMLATTANGFLSDVKPSVQVRAGQEKDVGKIRMRHGEELSGRVLDTQGKPIAEAEVLAGSTLNIAPVDLAQKVGKSDAEGRFSAQGFAPGKVTVAARRGRGHAWVLAEPQSILGEVVVTLPATFAVDATVTLADGKPAANARLKLLQGRAGNGAAELHLIGIVPAIDLQDRKQSLGEGHWRIGNLNAGTYTLLADAPGCATSFATFEISTADATTALQLTAPNVFAVTVVDPKDKPVRNAAIYAQASGSRAVEIPVLAGRTGTDGTLRIDKLKADSLRVSADHPKWGVVHGELKLGETLVLRMQAPGALHGVVRDNGKPPEPGKFTVGLMRRRGDGPRGPIESMPMLLTPGLDGTFTSSALQPGEYTLNVVKALDALRSPGSVFAFAQEASMSRDLPSERVAVASGQTAEVALEVGEKPILGPTAQLSGTVTVDGRLGAGSIVTANGKNRRFTARVDDRGRFDLGTVSAEELWVTVSASAEGDLFGPENNLWAQTVKLTAGEGKDLTIEVQTSSIRGVCCDESGAPIAGLFVQARGALKGAEKRSNVWRNTSTDAKGEFSFSKVAEGQWSISARGSGRDGMRGELEALEVTGGIPVSGLRLTLRPAVAVKGRIDLSVLGGKKANWIWVSTTRLGDGDVEVTGKQSPGIGVARDTGNFTSQDLTPGRYRLRLHVGFDNNENGEYPLDVLVVPPAGLDGVVLRPGARVQR